MQRLLYLAFGSFLIEALTSNISPVGRRPESFSIIYGVLNKKVTLWSKAEITAMNVTLIESFVGTK